MSEDVPVAGVVVEVAESLGMDPSQDAARFMSEFVRLLYSTPEERNSGVRALREAQSSRRGGASPAPVNRVPVPLTAQTWSDIIFGRPVSADELVLTIAADRRAALVCYALAALDDETLAYLAGEPAVLRRLYDHDSAAFAAFGATLRIRSGRVVPPGGEPAAPLWEAAVGQSTAQPLAFVDALFSLHRGQLAYLYDLVHHLDEPRRRFVLGSWLDPSERVARFAGVALQLSTGYDAWDLQSFPFSRPLNDLSFALIRLTVEPSGRPLAPAARGFWARALQLVSATPPDDDSPFDALWLVQALSIGDLYRRGDRLDQFGFGHRVFRDLSRDEWADAAKTVEALPRQRMLMLTLERMGIRKPAVYAAASRRADSLAAVRSGQLFWTLAQFQGALALVARMTVAGTMDVAEAERLILSLVAIDHDTSGRYRNRVADWITRELMPALQPGDDVEQRLTAALAGPSPGAAAPRLWWEGQQYLVDLPGAERLRLGAVRAKQGGATVDLALAVNQVVATLSASTLDAAQVRLASRDLNEVLVQFASRIAGSGSDVTPPGAPSHRQVQERVERLAADLARAAASENVRRASQLGSSLAELLESLLGEALLSWAYAADIGDPDGTALLARNVALRHNFGLGRSGADTRLRMMWATPYQDFLPGVPWHVSGSALGLDLALAPLALRRTDLNRIGAGPPKLPSNEREAFPINVALLQPRRLEDADRDAIAQAAAKGRARVAALAQGREGLDQVADELKMDGWRRRAIRWMLEQDRDAIPAMFALVELVELGGAGQMDLDAWGLAVHNSYGCVCTRLVGADSWLLLRGRPRIGLMASAVSDLNLQVAIALSELEVPAALARPVLAAAMLDFIETVAPTDANDWWTLVRTAQAVPRERIEDYIAGAAAIDGPLVPDDRGTSAVK